MIGIHIVCAHDAVKLAETLIRLLEAEQHTVRLSFGRQSQGDIEEAKASKDAVILIWSENAPSQHYMLEWARQIPAERLIEVARSPNWPRSARKAPVIDFINWRGVRGARAWNTLNDRLRTVSRALEPAKPQPNRAVLALGFASLAAVGGAIAVRVNDAPAPTIEAVNADNEMLIAFDDPISGIGGPLAAIEPASADKIEAQIRAPRYAALELQRPELLETSSYTAPELRDPTLMERLSTFNPLRRDESDEN